MRIQGHTFQEIADACGWSSKSTAYRAIHDELARVVREPMEALLTLELERLDAMQAALWPRAMDGSPRIQAAAVRQLVNIMARRSKLLGLDDFERRSIELAEKRHALDEAQARMVYEFMNRVFNNLELTAEQRARVPDVMQGELGRITQNDSNGGDTVL